MQYVNICCCIFDCAICVLCKTLKKEFVKITFRLVDKFRREFQYAYVLVYILECYMLNGAKICYPDVYNEYVEGLIEDS